VRAFAAGRRGRSSGNSLWTAVLGSAPYGRIRDAPPGAPPPPLKRRDPSADSALRTAIPRPFVVFGELEHQRMSPARRLSLAGLALVTSLLALAPAASADRTFSLRYQTVDKADSVFVANTLMTCSGGGCGNVQAGTDTSQGNGSFNEVNVDQDADASTFSSSSANLTLPVGATVLFAGLYWGADTTAGTNGSAAPTPASNNVVRFRTPTAAYQNVTASVVDTDSQRTSRFQGFADVTNRKSVV
jgi:hypothetical protein